MPLAFKSVNFGKIAFGFFNIDSDMLLLENYFFFAEDFAKYMNEISKTNRLKEINQTWNIYIIESPDNIGDLMGAIHGITHTGFIGELYKKYPFPKKQKDFKQKPDGYKNRKTTKSIIDKYAKKTSISFSYNIKSKEISIGKVILTIPVFHELLNYVWAGGYPRWKDESPPEYVENMKLHIKRSDNNIFYGLTFNDRG